MNMLNGENEKFSGFLIHAYPDTRRNRLYLIGRLSNSKSFAAVVENKDWRPRLHIFENDYSKVTRLLKNFHGIESSRVPLESFSGKEKLICFEIAFYSERLNAAAILEKEGIQSPDAGIKPSDLYLIEKQIKGPLLIKGIPHAGKRVDFIFRSPEIYAPEGTQVSHAPLRIASVDIETDVKTDVIRAIGIAWADTDNNEIQINNDTSGETSSRVRILSPSNYTFRAPQPASIIPHSDEKSMLCAFLEDIRIIDPDILTGWNFLDFDFPHLSRRFEKYGIPFTIGRSRDSAKFLPGDDSGAWRRRSAAAIVPGRQVIDALRVIRSGTQLSRAGGLSLDEVAQSVLGEGKTIHETGDEKIGALDNLYLNDPESFAGYCIHDARLVLRILSKTGMYRLTVERACLTGVPLDKAWTSVVSFERIYAMELEKRGITAAVFNEKDVTGASGGTVLDAQAGLFENVAVFDFRSLYPTIMRTFNIDPLSNARVSADEEKIVAPNAAAFSKKPGVLPALIADYFKTRAAALAKGDSIAAQVYKILMNSFYGFLGTSACRYGKSSLAGAITSFARKWLLFSRDWFNSKGLCVLYGDTDSLFVQTGLGDVPLAEFKKYCVDLCDELNALITKTVKNEYNLDSFLELRFDKAYRRFLIPPVRNIHSSTEDSQSKYRAESRGRAKGYGGALLNSDGSLTVDVVGMEAVRSDSTPLARRLQLELLEIVFSGCGEDEYRIKVSQAVKELRSGKCDHELIYRKRLARYPETYTSSTPPQVKAARALGWKKRRGTVEYVWTVNGPEPYKGQSALCPFELDYDHYVETQVFPLVRSIAAAAGWDAGFFVMRKDGGLAGSQMELMF